MGSAIIQDLTDSQALIIQHVRCFKEHLIITTTGFGNIIKQIVRMVMNIPLFSHLLN
jgi:hypothetical protein